MSRWALVILVAAAPLSAHAGGASDPALKGHLERADSAEKDGHFTAAVWELEQARAIAPQNVKVLTELGWVALRAGDLWRAERNTRAAIAVATDPASLGALHYNLGRVLEEQGKDDLADAAYTRSLELRPNELVARHQKTLAARRVFVPEAVCSQAGTRQKVCACLVAHFDGLDGQEHKKSKKARCDTDRRIPQSSAEVWRVVHAERDGFYLVDKQDAGTWRGVSFLGGDVQGNNWDQVAEVKSAAAARAGSRWFTMLTVTRAESAGPNNAESATTAVWVCPHEPMRCTLVLPVAGHASAEGRDRTAWAASIEFDSDGIATVRKKSGKAPRGVIGRHDAWKGSPAGVHVGCARRSLTLETSGAGGNHSFKLHCKSDVRTAEKDGAAEKLSEAEWTRVWDEIDRSGWHALHEEDGCAAPVAEQASDVKEMRLYLVTENLSRVVLCPGNQLHLPYQRILQAMR